MKPRYAGTSVINIYCAFNIFYLVGGGGVPVQGVLPHCLTVIKGAGVLTVDETTGRDTTGLVTTGRVTTGWGTNGVGL